jgi:hypothetical protein
MQCHWHSQAAAYLLAGQSGKDTPCPLEASPEFACTGEGGENPRRLEPNEDGSNNPMRSAIKQVGEQNP